MDEMLGRVAYEAYGNTVNWQTVTGKEMPQWEDQSDKLRGAWAAAAKAVKEHVGIPKAPEDYDG
jgi:hypothetical protein